MAGIYIHIPFCKKKCSYCDFHFSTSFNKKSEMVEAIKKELFLRKDEITQPIETIYFGGGTPSVCSNQELMGILNVVYDCFNVSNVHELTLEANPDDLTLERLKQLADIGFNRLSMGVQSFFDSDLKLMNRNHNAEQSIEVIKNAKQYFDNISIDLIYGIPESTIEHWKKNVEIALGLNIPHISSYALTVEKKTALEQWVKKKSVTLLDDKDVHSQFLLLISMLENKGFVHYELSNFGKPGFFSKNNTAYWIGKSYIGIGPSAHSFNGNQRSWNIANNKKYIEDISKSVLPREIEILSTNDQYNEYVMTGLRTCWGVSIEKIKQDFGEKYVNYLLKHSKKFIQLNQLDFNDGTIKTTINGRFLVDGIAASLFYL